MISTNNGGPSVSKVSIDSPTSAFGEVTVVQPTPSINVDFLKGVLSDVSETLTATGGSVEFYTTGGGKSVHCQSGTSVGGYGLVRSKRVVRYRPGEGTRARWTARFGTFVANSAQRAGLLNTGSELSFGYGDPNDGTNTSFGLLYRTGGRLEIQKLEITAAATGAETATITLAGTAYTVTLSNGTASHNCFEIAGDSDFGITQAWTAWQNDGNVYFVANSVGDKTGTFSFSSTGTATGTFTEIQAGVGTTDTWIDQADWNINTLTDASRDGFVLDPTKGNIFEVRFQYLGYGVITYSVADPATGMLKDVHSVKYPNSSTIPNLESPVFHISWFAASLGSTTNTEIWGVSAYAAVDGDVTPTKNPIAHSNTKSSIGTTLTNVLSLRNSPIINGVINESSMFPKFINVAVDGTKNAVIELHLNPTLGGEPNWTYHEEGTHVAEIDTAATTVSGNTEVVVFPVDKAGSISIDLTSLNIRMNRTDVLTIAVKATSATTEATAALTWSED